MSVYILSNTINRCKDKFVELKIFVSPEFLPKSMAYNSAVNDIRSVADYNIFKDYSSLSFFMTDSPLFKDSSHLNDKDASIYTNYIVNSFDTDL